MSQPKHQILLAGSQILKLIDYYIIVALIREVIREVTTFQSLEEKAGKVADEISFVL